ANAQKAYQSAIDLGDSSAMIALADMLTAGDGVGTNFDRARTLLQGAISAGNLKNGSRALGHLYATADARHKDAAKAVTAYEAAANLGDNPARIALARILAIGDGVPVDFDRARSLIESAVNS